MDLSAAYSHGVWSSSGQIISAAIEPRVLSVPWAMAQLGWIAGPVVLVLFSYLAYYNSTLLIQSYANGGSNDNGNDVSNDSNLFRRYPEVVRARLGGGGIQAKMCRLFQIIYLLGLVIGQTDAASISMMNLRGVPEIMCSEDSSCDALPPTMLYLIVFGVAQIILSHIPIGPNLMSRLSMLALTLIYSGIGVGVAIAKIAENHTLGGSLAGTPIGAAWTPYDKTWSALKALGELAFAFVYPMIFIEIQGTQRPLLRPEESTMKRALALSALATTFVYLLLSAFGYAAYGDSAPRNVLSESFNPEWVVKTANAAAVIQLMIAYQANCKPLFEFVEKSVAPRLQDDNNTRTCKSTLFRVAWRAAFVIFTTGIAILLPADNVGGLLVAIGFWPVTVYYPVAIYITQTRTQTWSIDWWALQILRLGCFVVAGFISFIPHLQSIE